MSHTQVARGGIAFILGVAALLGHPVMAQAALSNPQSAPRQTPAQSAAESINAFALDLQRALPRIGNSFFSPYSIHAALSMTREGAAGETAAQMERVLHRLDRAGHRALAADLEPSSVSAWEPETGGRIEAPAYRLNIANRLWGQDGMGFHEGFLSRLAGGYAAPLARADFRRSDEVRAEINGWVSAQTSGRIPQLIPPGVIHGDSRLVLVSAIDMVASWREAFPEGRTAPGSFTTAAAGTVEVPMMHRDAAYRYASDEDATVLELPYRADLSMLIMLPRDADGIGQLESKLSSERLDGWVDALAPQQVAVTLPRFSLRSSLRLHEVLSGMGMPDAFDPSVADFSRMSDEKLCIDLVLHQGFVSVDEAGTEAAAATAVMMKFTGRPPAAAIRFQVDRPFLFAIRHQPTGCILFFGRVADPRG